MNEGGINPGHHKDPRGDRAPDRIIAHFLCCFWSLSTSILRTLHVPDCFISSSLMRCQSRIQNTPGSPGALCARESSLATNKPTYINVEKVGWKTKDRERAEAFNINQSKDVRPISVSAYVILSAYPKRCWQLTVPYFLVVWSFSN